MCWRRANITSSKKGEKEERKQGGIQYEKMPLRKVFLLNIRVHRPKEKKGERRIRESKRHVIPASDLENGERET